MTNVNSLEKGNSAANKSNPNQLLPTLDKSLKNLFVWFTRDYLVDYYYVFIAAPIILTGVLACGFIWLEQATILDAKKLYTPASAPSNNLIESFIIY